MPFQSEKQRRYLWANEPEIARDWTDTYGSRIQKKNGGIMSIQGGVENYEPSEMVNVPRKAKSSPDHPSAHLAYITDKEQDLLVKMNLYGSLKGNQIEDLQEYLVYKETLEEKEELTEVMKARMYQDPGTLEQVVMEKVVDLLM